METVDGARRCPLSDADPVTRGIIMQSPASTPAAGQSSTVRICGRLSAPRPSRSKVAGERASEFAHDVVIVALV